MNDIEKLRSQGAQLTAIVCAVIALLVICWSVYEGKLWLAVLATLLCIFPVYAGLTRKTDRLTRIALGATVPAFAALLVAAAKGTAWIVDMHMTFFALLAVLAIMADWRAVIAGTLVTAVHHIALNFIAPAYIFPDGADFSRVLLHAVIVLAEAGVLVLLCFRLENLVKAMTLANHEREKQQNEIEKERNRNQADLNLVLKSVGQRLGSLSNGNLVDRIEENFPAEYDALRHDLNATSGELECFVGKVARTSSDVAIDAQDMKRAATYLADQVEAQSRSIDTMSFSSKRLLEDFDRDVEGWSKTRESAQSAKEDFDRGTLMLDSAAAAMSRIKESSSKINEMVMFIDEISFQTNLLALNAGVEAARAGDAGKGFAVVANEVRELAGRSSESASGIKEVIAKSNNDIAQGVEWVGETVTLLGQTVAKFGAILEMIESVTEGSQGTQAAIENINMAVAELEALMQKNAALAEQSNAASVQLANRASTLKTHLSEFSYREGQDSEMGLKAA